jgi:hypothetical protein
MRRSETNQPPTYVSEVRFYRTVLGCAYESGSRWRKLGVIQPDATCDEKPIFLLSPESIRAARERINQYKATIARSRQNLPTTALCEKMSIVTA